MERIEHDIRSAISQPMLLIALPPVTEVSQSDLLTSTSRLYTSLCFTLTLIE